MDKTNEDLPLHEEALAREKWRGGDVDNGPIASGAGEEEDGRPGKGGPGTIPPPD